MINHFEQEVQVYPLITYPSIFLMGPTAAGKTELAIFLTQMLPCDIISVDSAMVYRGMDIGTAKPDPATLLQTPHRLIDICDPKEIYSAAQFCNDARREIKQIQMAGRIPLLVGGTGLYFRALQQGLSDIPSADPHIRQYLVEQAEQKGWITLHQQLADVDPIAAQRIHPHDTQRIQRALEVYLISGQPITTWYAQAPLIKWSEPVIKLIVAPRQREVLHARIAQRFRAMLAQGFIEEVRKLLLRDDLSPTLPALRAVGYRQVWQYLTGKLAENQLPEQAIIATRQLAKRQLTWLRSETAACWFDSQQPTVAQQVLKYLADHPFLLPKEK